MTSTATRQDSGVGVSVGCGLGAWVGFGIGGIVGIEVGCGVVGAPVCNLTGLTEGVEVGLSVRQHVAEHSRRTSLPAGVFAAHWSRLPKHWTGSRSRPHDGEEVGDDVDGELDGQGVVGDAVGDVVGSVVGSFVGSDVGLIVG